MGGSFAVQSRSRKPAMESDMDRISKEALKVAGLKDLVVLHERQL